jgi:S-adenosylmethionine hydrolase
MNSSIIALITDFGNLDPYVGIMKAVLSDLSPDSTLIDITHEIPPGDIQRGAYVLWQAARDFPAGSVFLCVVDPGVGTERKPILLKVREQVFIGPDNGLFSYLLFKQSSSCWELKNASLQLNSKSTTFHGRDIFAPAAAHAANGISGEHFGDPLDKMIRLPDPILDVKSNSMEGEILSSDRFGNLVTSLGKFTLQDNSGLKFQSWINDETLSIAEPATMKLTSGKHQLPFVNTFGSVAPGQTATLVGSTGLLEIVINQGSAKDRLSLKEGVPVELSWD